MKWIRPAVFGAADGMTCVLGAVLSLSGHDGLVLRTAVALAAAECVGMAAGEWLSDSDAGLAASAVIGLSSAVGALIPAIPYGFATGPTAVAWSTVLFLACAAVIAAVRVPQRGGWRAVAETYGVFAAIAVAVWLSQLLTPKGGGP